MDNIREFTKDKSGKLEANLVECLNLKTNEDELWTPPPGDPIQDKSGNGNHGVFCGGKLWQV